MSAYKNQWKSNDQQMRIEKLNENETYEIVNVEKIETSFGKRYVLIDVNDCKFWPNKSVDQFIHEHKQIKKFQLITSEFKTFKNKKNEDITFLDVEINY